MPSVGMEFLSSVLSDQHGAKRFIDAGLSDAMFLESEQDSFSAFSKHFKKYGVIPDPSTLEKMVDNFSLPATVEPPKFYADKVRERFTFRSLRAGMQEARGYMDASKPSFDPAKALEVMQETTIALLFTKNQQKIMDFRLAHESLLKEHHDVMKGLDPGIKMGWETLDEMANGLFPGDVVSIVGRPAMGKTFKLLYSAHNVWYRQQVPTMFISMEMMLMPINQRLAAMHTHYGLTKFKKAEMTTDVKNNIFTELQALEGFDEPLWVVDGNLTSSLDDIWGLCQQLQPEALYIDGGYLVKTGNLRQNKQEQVSETIEGFKSQLATELGIPVIISYQFNREAAKKSKKKDGEKPGLEDIGYSDAIGQVSSLVLATLEHEGIETKQNREIDIMKGRNGETGVFTINWDFDKMDFSETISENDNVEELNYT